MAASAAVTVKGRRVLSAVSVPLGATVNSAALLALTVTAADCASSSPFFSKKATTFFPAAGGVEKVTVQSPVVTLEPGASQSPACVVKVVVSALYCFTSRREPSGTVPLSVKTAEALPSVMLPPLTAMAGFSASGVPEISTESSGLPNLLS